MMMDSFDEQLVVRKNSAKHAVRLVVYLLLIFTVPAVFFLLGFFDIGTRYFVIVGVCALFFAVYGSYYLVTGLYTEYEYAVTNSNITIDKITAKRSRKRIISVDIKKLNTMRKLKDADNAHKSYKKIFEASMTSDGDDVYACEMHLDKFGGDCLLLFSPDEKTLEAMKPYLRTNIKTEFIKNGTFKAGKTEKAEKTENNDKKIVPEKKGEAPAQDKGGKKKK